MKIGDLVELSAAGHNIVYCKAMVKKTGIVVKIRASGMYPIDVHWFNNLGIKVHSHHRANLKYLSKQFKR